jgi:hypothetical protein
MRGLKVKRHVGDRGLYMHRRSWRPFLQVVEVDAQSGPLLEAATPEIHRGSHPLVQVSPHHDTRISISHFLAYCFV